MTNAGRQYNECQSRLFMSQAAHVNLETQAAKALTNAFGAGDTSMMGRAPGRVPVVGEHVDYVGGRVACVAIDLEVVVAVRVSRDGVWRVCSANRLIERPDPSPVGDIGDRVFAAGLALRRRFPTVPAVEVGVAASLPESAGLSSSAAIVVATVVALLRLTDKRLTTEELVEVALRAEREIVGVPCGSLDQQAVVRAPDRNVLVLDFLDNTFETVAWPWPDVCIVVADSGESHDVGGSGYGERRLQAELVLEDLGVSSCQEIGTHWPEFQSAELQRRARHITSETARTDEAIRCLADGNAVALGRLVSLSHKSLRYDFEVSTRRIDAMVGAAERTPGCYGARIVGGGFGGSAIALCDEAASSAVREAMARNAGRCGLAGTWVVHPSAGVAVTAEDVVLRTPA